MQIVTLLKIKRLMSRRLVRFQKVWSWPRFLKTLPWEFPIVAGKWPVHSIISSERSYNKVRRGGKVQKRFEEVPLDTVALMRKFGTSLKGKTPPPPLGNLVEGILVLSWWSFISEAKPQHLAEPWSIIRLETSMRSKGSEQRWSVASIKSSSLLLNIYCTSRQITSVPSPNIYV